jgi:hypothetical protein
LRTTRPKAARLPQGRPATITDHRRSPENGGRRESPTALPRPRVDVRCYRPRKSGLGPSSVGLRGGVDRQGANDGQSLAVDPALNVTERGRSIRCCSPWRTPSPIASTPICRRRCATICRPRTRHFSRDLQSRVRRSGPRPRQEEGAYLIAWAAVKRAHEKEGDYWVRKQATGERGRDRNCSRTT